MTTPMSGIAAEAARALDPINSLAHLRAVVAKTESDAEPIDVACVTTWLGLGSACGDFLCKYCDGVCGTGYEVNFQWGDTARFVHVFPMCARCLSLVCSQSRNAKNSKYVLARQHAHE